MTDPAPSAQSTRRQGTLLAFGLAGAMTVALTSCRRETASTPMIVPPTQFTTNQAVALEGTNAPPAGNYVHAGGGYAPWLYSRGYYPIYGFPDYYAKPAPGSTFQLVSGASGSYRAGSAAEANESVSRGGFGSHGGGEGGGE